MPIWNLFESNWIYGFQVSFITKLPEYERGEKKNQKITVWKFCTAEMNFPWPYAIVAKKLQGLKGE